MNHKKDLSILFYSASFDPVCSTVYPPPSAMGLALSFTDWNSVSDEIHFVGLSHFIEIFTNSRYLIVIRNTLIFAIITTLFKNVIGLGMALVLNKEFKTRNILRTIFFLPGYAVPSDYRSGL